MKAGDIFRSFQLLWGFGALVTATGPLALWARDLQPPFPEESQAITTLVCVLVAILSFMLGRQLARTAGGKAWSQPNRSRLMSVLGAITVVLGLACGAYYMMTFERYVVTVEQTVENETRRLRRVIGTELRGEWLSTTETPRQLLEDNGYDPEAVWTRESLLHAQFLVFATFVATFALLTFGLVQLAAVSSSEPA